MISTALSALNLSYPTHQKKKTQRRFNPDLGTTQRGQDDYAIMVQSRGFGRMVWLAFSSGLFLNTATPGCGEVDLGWLIISTVCTSALQLLRGLGLSRTAGDSQCQGLSNIDLQRRKPCASLAAPARSSSNLRKLPERVTGFHYFCHFLLNLVFGSLMPAQIRNPTVPEC